MSMPPDSGAQFQPTFLTIPTELRLRIYELLWDGDDPYDKIINPTKRCPYRWYAFAHSITRTSRQCRRESIPILYGAAELVMSFDSQDEVKQCKHWLEIVDPWALSHIRRFKMCRFRHECMFMMVHNMHSPCKSDILIDLMHPTPSITETGWRGICCSKSAKEVAERITMIHESLEAGQKSEFTKRDLFELIKVMDVPERGTTKMLRHR